ncbi:hypothetical protein ACS0TY_021761 [Phlomoides rotata]
MVPVLGIIIRAILLAREDQCHICRPPRKIHPMDSLQVQNVILQERVFEDRRKSQTFLKAGFESSKVKKKLPFIRKWRGKGTQARDMWRKCLPISEEMVRFPPNPQKPSPCVRDAWDSSNFGLERWILRHLANFEMANSFSKFQRQPSTSGVKKGEIGIRPQKGPKRVDTNVACVKSCWFFNNTWENLLKGMKFRPKHFITDVSGKYPRLWALKGANPNDVRIWYEFGALASIYTVAPCFREISELLD